MSQRGISTYKLKPFEFTVQKISREATKWPFVLNKVVFSDTFIFAYGFNVHVRILFINNFLYRINI